MASCYMYFIPLQHITGEKDTKGSSPIGNQNVMLNADILFKTIYLHKVIWIGTAVNESGGSIGLPFDILTFKMFHYKTRWVYYMGHFVYLLVYCSIPFTLYYIHHYVYAAAIEQPVMYFCYFSYTICRFLSDSSRIKHPFVK